MFLTKNNTFFYRLRSNNINKNKKFTQNYKDMFGLVVCDEMKCSGVVINDIPLFGFANN